MEIRKIDGKTENISNNFCIQFYLYFGQILYFGLAPTLGHLTSEHYFH